MHTNLDDELQLLSKEANLTPETDMKMNEPFDESHLTVRKSKSLPYAKQPEKLGGIPYYTNNKKKKTSNNCILQEKQINQPEQLETNSNEELDNRNIRSITENLQTNRMIRTFKLKQPYIAHFTWRGMWNANIKLPHFIT